ncbi:CAMK family protein kinase [Tritrichomonas foetus]|uniref:CAMK family protein kinase n=1 Tax=Tritrichomonas foetus TaxID=1144522 RepID=A0A1J4KRB9_9EUKA|nr:CAMK family protein kinase [Tritrichomonas foetus]|eukprot:OHT13642.1 CAMK family protein kinase [Tritrichomonas foetus]
MASMMTPENIQIVGPYELRGVIGEGAFSVVRLACHIETQQFCACKIVQRSRLSFHNLDARFENEIRINQQLHHPGIVQLIDLLKDDQNYYIIMEFCPNGELFQYIISRGRLEEGEAKIFINQVLKALRHVHSCGVCHRDMKPENLLMDEVGRIKISDFGLSRFTGRYGLVNTPCGSPCYASPECISGKPYDGFKSDIWSVGVISYAMLTGQLPWTKRNQQQLFEQIRKGEYVIPPFVSENARQFIYGLMTVDGSQRITIDAALRHPFLQDAPPPPPPQVFNQEWISPSLKKIDFFFDRDVNDQSLENIQIEKCPSMATTQVDPTTRLLMRKMVQQQRSFGHQSPLRRFLPHSVKTTSIRPI